jgi:exodeoxyribonuclease VII small subunit
MTKATKTTFEQGYEELKRIVGVLDGDEASVAERIELFAKGKGIGRSLLGWLDDQEGRIEEIEQGRNIPEFEITAISKRPEPTEDEDVDFESVNQADADFD